MHIDEVDRSYDEDPTMTIIHDGPPTAMHVDLPEKAGDVDRMFLVFLDRMIERIRAGQAMARRNVYVWIAAISVASLGSIYLIQNGHATRGMVAIMAGIAALWTLFIRRMRTALSEKEDEGKEILRRLTSWEHHSLFEGEMRGEIAVRISALQKAVVG